MFLAIQALIGTATAALPAITGRSGTVYSVFASAATTNSGMELPAFQPAVKEWSTSMEFAHAKQVFMTSMGNVLKSQPVHLGKPGTDFDARLFSVLLEPSGMEVFAQHQQL